MAKQKKENVNPVGRPTSNKPVEDMAKGYPVSITPNQKKYLVEKFGGLTKAIKTLLK